MRNTIKKILKENDFDWTNEVKPIGVGEIWDKIKNIGDYGANNWFLDRIAEKTHGLGLLNDELSIFADIVKEVAEMSHSHGTQIGWEEGSRDGDCSDEVRKERLEGYKEGYDEGYGEGKEDGVEDGKDQIKKEFNEIKEIIYNKGFEEGRMYEAELDSEEYEKREGGLDFEYEN